MDINKIGKNTSYTDSIYSSQNNPTDRSKNSRKPNLGGDYFVSELNPEEDKYTLIPFKEKIADLGKGSSMSSSTESILQNLVKYEKKADGGHKLKFISEKTKSEFEKKLGEGFKLKISIEDEEGNEVERTLTDKDVSIEVMSESEYQRFHSIVSREFAKIREQEENNKADGKAEEGADANRLRSLDSERITKITNDSEKADDETVADRVHTVITNSTKRSRDADQEIEIEKERDKKHKKRKLEKADKEKRLTRDQTEGAKEIKQEDHENIAAKEVGNKTSKRRWGTFLSWRLTR